ncbi:MAG: hypothetical protein ACREDL_10760 [Bradyrhizobium sp.]
MPAEERVHAIETEIDNRARDLKETVSALDNKVQNTWAHYDPARYIREYPLLVPGCALLLGLLAGYLIPR